MREESWEITLPGDLYDDMDRLKGYAIVTAREEAADYVIPANWYVEHLSGEIGDCEVKFKVTRISR